jgi:hypothetical protein
VLTVASAAPYFKMTIGQATTFHCNAGHYNEMPRHYNEMLQHYSEMVDHYSEMVDHYSEMVMTT